MPQVPKEGNMSLAKRPGLLLTVAGIAVGLIVAALIPLRHRAANMLNANLTPTPVVGFADAQRQVKFQIDVPRDIPQGYRMIGARVFQVKLLDTPQTAGMSPVQRKPFHGYGIFTSIPTGPGKPFMLLALKGSEAEKAGLPSDHEEAVLAVNGVKVVYAVGEQPHISNFHKIPPPLVLTMRNPQGVTHVVTIGKVGDFFIGDPPQLPTDKRAALLYNGPGSSFAVVESQPPPPSLIDVKLAALSHHPMTYFGANWSDQVEGIDITFYGTKATPDATFDHGGIHYEIANDKGNLTQAQIEQIAKSL